MRVLKAELLKLKGAKAVWGTVAIVASFAFMTLAFSDLGGTASSNDTWEQILSIGPPFMAAWWGLMVFGLATSSLFGAELSEGTASSILTTPIRREYFVAAKLIVLALWVAFLALVSVTCQSLVAVLLGADGFAWSLVATCLVDNLHVALMLYLTLPVVALISMLGRGYLAPMLYSTALTALSMTAGWVGWERWVPWAMPITVAGGIGPPGMFDKGLPAASWGILIGMFVLGLTALTMYMNWADFRS